MRVLVVSDIHGNLAALEAVNAEPRDAVVCLGDLVNYGPKPGACVRWAMANADIVVQGNHDRAIADNVPTRCREQFRWLVDATAPIAKSELNTGETIYLGGLPQIVLRTFDDVRYMFVHAAPSDPLYRYLGPDAEQWAAELGGVEADVLMVGHTHLQFDLTLGSQRVVNPGSVGQPKDGNPHAAYAIIEDGTITLKRMGYPVQHTVDSLRVEGVAPDAVGTLSELLRTGRVPSPGGPAATSAHPA